MPSKKKLLKNSQSNKLDRYNFRYKKNVHSNGAGNGSSVGTSSVTMSSTSVDRPADAGNTGLGSGPGPDNKIDEILKAVKGLELKIDTKTQEIIDDVSVKLEKLGQRVDTISKKSSELETSVNFAHDEIKDLRKAEKTTEGAINKINEKLVASESHVRSLEREIENMKKTTQSKVNDLERHSRKFSIRVHNVGNIPEGKPPEVYNRMVACILAENDIIEAGPRTLLAWDHVAEQQRNQNDNVNGTPSAAIIQNRTPPGTPWTDLPPEKRQERVAAILQEIEIAHPIGARGNQLIARLYSRPFRNKVLSLSRQKLPKGENRLRITEDMTKVDYELKKQAIPQMRAAYETGKKCTFRNGKLIIDGRTVDIE